MRIAFVTTRPNKASFKFRVAQYLPCFEQKGLKYDILILPRGQWSRRLFFKQLRNYDVVFWQKRLLSWLDFWDLRRNSRYLIYDFDDSVMYNNTKNGNEYSHRLNRRFQNMVEHADLVIGGNPFLVEQAAPYADVQKLVRIPTVVDLEVWKTETPEAAATGDIIIGWVGSQSTLPYWMDKLALWKTISRKYPQVMFKVTCDDVERTFSSPEYRDFRFQAVEWTEASQVRDCDELDIALMPLPDNLSTRGKCGFKLIQYMSLGKAAVASPVGVNSDIILDKKTGLLAASDEDWINGLSLLIENEKKRLELGSAGYQHVKENYSLQAWCDFLYSLLQRG